jgi:glycosyltransferase involved in cell wall biosynthesis
MQLATLSAFLTNYNDADVVGRALDAITSQSRLPDEFIIQDDGSTDNSIEVIMPYVEKYSFIKFVKNERNLGPIPAMQKCSSLATGDYIYGAGADDWVLPGFFEKAMNLLEKYPHASICCGDIYDYYADTGETTAYEMLWADQPTYFSPDQLADTLAGRNFPGMAGSIMRRDAFVNAGGFIAELKWHSDWFFNHVVAFRHGIVYVPEKFAVETARQKGAYCFEGVQNPKMQANVLRAAINLLKSPQFIDVFPYFARSAAFFPFSYSAVKLLMNDSELWDIPTILLLQHSLYIWNNQMSALRNDRVKQGVESKLKNIIIKIDLMIQNGQIIDAQRLIENIQQAFGRVPAIAELKEKINRLKR